MHLGHQTGTLCPILWRQILEALVLKRSFRLPQTQAPNIIWIQEFKKGNQINLIRNAPFPESLFIWLSKVPVNEPAPGSPTGPLWRELPVSRAFFYMSLEFLKKLLLENFALLSKGLGKGWPNMFPKTWSLWKQTPISKVLLSIFFWVPSKGTFPLYSPHRAPTQRDAPFPEPSFIQFSKSLVNELPYRFPSRTRMKKNARFQSLLLHILQGPQ